MREIYLGLNDCFIYLVLVLWGFKGIKSFVWFENVGLVPAPQTVPLDSFSEKQGGHLRGVSTEGPGHEGLLTWGELETS